MAELIAPIVSTMLSVLQARTPALLASADLPPIAQWGSEWTGVVLAWPALWAMPIRTQFDPEGSLRHQLHDLTIKIGVQSTTPEQLATLAMAYMQVIDAALDASDPADWAAALTGGEVTRLFVQGHDYGPLYQRGNAMARFPEMTVQIETQEV